MAKKKKPKVTMSFIDHSSTTPVSKLFNYWADQIEPVNLTTQQYAGTNANAGILFVDTSKDRAFIFTSAGQSNELDEKLLSTDLLNPWHIADDPPRTAMIGGAEHFNTAVRAAAERLVSGSDKYGDSMTLSMDPLNRGNMPWLPELKCTAISTWPREPLTPVDKPVITEDVIDLSDATMIQFTPKRKHVRSAHAWIQWASGKLYDNGKRVNRSRKSIRKLKRRHYKE